MRSSERRWAPGTGEEWALVQASATVTDAGRVLRLLCNGVSSRARWRTAGQRAARRCVVCGDAGVTLAWSSPAGPEADEPGPGLGWCRGCAGQWNAGNCWAALPELDLPCELWDRAREITRCRGPLTEFVAQLSQFGACPLCGTGEAGSEHLWMWCPAVALAWSRCGRDDDMARAFASGATAPEHTAAFISQVVFLHAAALGRATPDL